jgi:YegS/Rv2252/BmrU family lipid kinase
VPAPICLIVNPAAGGGRAGRAAPVAERALRAHGLAVRRVDTRDLDHARELGLEAASAGETIVALSGDGMLGALADALRDLPTAVLGVIPGGRGNDLARILGIPDDPAAAAAIIAEGHTRPVDLGSVQSLHPGAEERAFICIASAGFDSDANRIANEAPSWLDGLVYLYAALRALMAWKPAQFEIELDPPGLRRSFTVFSIGACNSKAYGGGMLAAPQALLDDGLLDVVVVESVGKLRFVTRILPKIFRGTHVQEPNVSVFRAREVTLSSRRPFTMYADGDPIGELPVRVRALPGAITLLLPRVDAPDSAFARGSQPSLARDGRDTRRVGQSSPEEGVRDG